MAQKVRNLFSDELYREDQSNIYVLTTGPREGQARAAEGGRNCGQLGTALPWRGQQEKAIRESHPRRKSNYRICVSLLVIVSPAYY